MPKLRAPYFLILFISLTNCSKQIPLSQPDPLFQKTGKKYAVATQGISTSRVALNRPELVAKDSFCITKPKLRKPMSSIFASQEKRKAILKSFKTLRVKSFLNSTGKPLQTDDLLLQEDLAQTLEILSQNPEDFYMGSIAKKITASTQSAPTGPITAQDLKNYQVKFREALQYITRVDGKEIQVLTMPPPSSGGVHVIQFLKAFQQLGLKEKHFENPMTLHQVGHLFQHMYADRAKYLGDSDFFKVPTSELQSDQHVEKWQTHFRPDRALKMEEVHANIIPGYESENTTHFSIHERLL